MRLRGGKAFYGFDGRPFFTLQVGVPQSVAGQLLRVENLDGIGPALSADPGQLKLINQTGSFGVLNGNVIPK
jgi:hypothetical protein